jgi:hypothetical protein
MDSEGKFRLTVAIAALALLSSIYGNYLQREQLRLQSPQVPVATEAAKHAAEPKAPPVSIFPFVLSSSSAVLLFLLLVLVSRQYAQSARMAKLNHDRLTELEKLPRRVGLVETGLPEVTKRLDSVKLDLNKLEKFVATNMQYLPEAVENHTERIKVIADKADVATQRLDEHRPWISDLEKAIKQTDRATSMLIRRREEVALSIPGFSLYMIEISNLIAEAQTAIDGLYDIRDRFPDVKSPFSQAWWRRDAPTVAPPALINWALFLKQHVKHCETFAARFSCSQSTIIDLSLQGYAHSWNNPLSMGDALACLSSHTAKLSSAREDYAATFSTEAAKFTIS